jgi:hypothetical protein
MVDRNFLLLAAFLFEPDQRSFSGLEVILDIQIHDGADPGKRISQGGKQRSVPMPDHVTGINGLQNLLDFFSAETPVSCLRSERI